MRSIFEYTDYRNFLNSFIAELKKEKPEASYRYICERVGVKSSGHLTLILKGKANISIALALRFSKFLQLKKRETEYFQYMVLFNQAKNHLEKKEYFEKLMAFKESAIHIVKANQYEYYDKWYHSVIRALIDFFPVRDNFLEVAKLVDPPLSAKEVESSIDLLLRLGMIKKNEQGYYAPVDLVIDTGVDVQSVAINNYALSTLELAKQALDRNSKDTRVLSWATLGISEKGYKQVVEELREFRRKIYTIAANDHAEQVYQINFQAFPLSRKYKEGGDK